MVQNKAYTSNQPSPHSLPKVFSRLSSIIEPYSQGWHSPERQLSSVWTIHNIVKTEAMLFFQNVCEIWTAGAHTESKTFHVALITENQFETRDRNVTLLAKQKVSHSHLMSPTGRRALWSMTASHFWRRNWHARVKLSRVRLAFLTAALASSPLSIRLDWTRQARGPTDRQLRPDVGFLHSFIFKLLSRRDRCEALIFFPREVRWPWCASGTE